MATDFSITLQAMKNLDDVLTTFRLSSIMFRVLPFVPFHEDWQGSNNNSFAVGDKARLEAINFVKETQDEIVDGCESKGGLNQ